ncbi:hypothetical protein RB628_04865 [Streptomyces sp. ADMS]|uniref:hypothetical protein n=1 Tax=Streptomyces sp. ADMS TaxID=3071415 RepID=UPI00296E37EB|nr:hypothetical protein [Streptomyces sp. ADMS]MDW4904692.1 hypothetical protein [Streptomyces sp. ADMS]
MTEQPDTLTRELALYVSDVLRKAVQKGNLTADDLEAAKDAMRAGTVLVRRDEGGAFTVRIGSVADIEGHIMDLPTIAGEWEAAAT